MNNANVGDLLNLATLILFCAPLAMIICFTALKVQAAARYA